MPDQIQRPATSYPKQVLSRRHLLGQLLTGAAAGWQLAAQPRSNQAREPVRPLRLAAIGVGNRGADNLTEIAQETIVALCDVDERYLKEAQVRHPAARTYHDYRELLEKEALDAVVISTPDHSHFPACHQALLRGLHVYCEKPLAHRVQESRQLAQLAAERRAVTQMGNQHHGSWGYRRVTEIVQSGCLGTVREVHAWTNRPLWPQSLARPPERPPVPDYLHWELWLGTAPARPYHPTYHPFGWRGWWDFGGGALGDMGPHLLDPVMTALQLSAPHRVSSQCDGGTDESAPRSSTVRFEFRPQENEAPVQLIWYDGDHQPPQEITRVKRLPANGVLLLGELGRLFIPELGEHPIVRPEPGKNLDVPESKLAATPSHMQEWLAACRGAGTASSPFSLGTQLTELCLLGNIALRRGTPIIWDAEKMSTGDAAADRMLSRKGEGG